MADESTPDEAFGAALASLEHMTPARLAALVDQDTFAAAWQQVSAGAASTQLSLLADASNAPTLAAALAREATSVDPAEVLEHHRQAGVQVVVRGGPGYPSVLADDPDAPVVLFLSGEPDALAARRVAIVGTRDCTRAGRDTAFEFGGDLARAGVAVVSGLALGIDCAAHAGAIDANLAPPIGVVGSGLDVVYPRRNAELWRKVAAEGLLVSEHPLGVRPRPWHFLARNRIIAGLAEVVVVVESHETGGALQTAQQADDRGTTVMAVPGSIRASACVGSNQLLTYPHTRCATSSNDVLAEIGVTPIGATAAVDARRRPSAFDLVVLEAVDWQPTSFEQLLERSGLSLGELTLSLDRLEEDRWLVRRGAWVERVSASATSGAPRPSGSSPVR